jgi:hypothetical protein
MVETHITVDLVELLGLGGDLHFELGGGFVNKVDGLIW